VSGDTRRAGAVGASHGDGDCIDVAGYVARVRRVADVSQRELAALVGVGRATLARWESGEVAMRVDDFAAVLGCANLKLVVLNGDECPVPPFHADAVRDNAGRRFPAHLDVLPPDQRPHNRGNGARYDRPPARGWYALRPERDASAGSPQVMDRRGDHPTNRELAERAERLRSEARRRARQGVGSRPLTPCLCLDGCFEVRGCLRECPCRCEPQARDQVVPERAASS
jgi:transcriptional regulator with XRE-family HTH domain